MRERELQHGVMRLSLERRFKQLGGLTLQGASGASADSPAWSAFSSLAYVWANSAHVEVTLIHA